MKKLITVLLACLLIVTATGCYTQLTPFDTDTDSSTKQPFVPVSTDYENYRLGYKMNSSAIDYDKALSEGKKSYFEFCANLFNQSKNGNTLISPASVYTALAMALNGADGETLAEMQEVLGGDINTVNAFCAALHSSIESVNDSDNDSKASIANSIWIKDDFKEYVLESYLKNLSNYYSNEIFTIPFDNNAVQMINKWTYNNTNGMIDKVIDKFGPDEVLELINALFVEGNWTEQEQITTQRTFKALDGTKKTAEFFGGDSALYESENAYAINRYAEGGIRFVAIMPKDSVGYENYLQKFDGNELYTLLNKINPRGAVYTVPEFKTDYTIELCEALNQMGMKTAFNPFGAANFTKLSNYPNGIYISKIVHKTAFELNRYGLKAAAVTVVSFDKCTSVGPDVEPPLVINFDKPFMYAICLKGVPLFIGCTEKL